MKRFFAILLIFAAILTGCVTAPDDTDPENPELTPTGPDCVDPTAGDGTVMWANWNEDPAIYENSLGYSITSDGRKSLPLYRFDSVEDVENFKSTLGEVFEMTYGWGSHPSFGQTSHRWTEDFFREKSVVITYVTAGSTGYCFRIGSVTVIDGHLRLAVERDPVPDDASMDCMMAGWLVSVEMDKADLTGVEEYSASLDILRYGE